MIEKLLVEFREIIQANKDFNFIFTWVRAHTGNKDNDSLGNAKADTLATQGLKLGFNSQIDTNKIFVNATEIHYTHPVAAASHGI